MENTFHSSGSEKFGQGKKGQEDQCQDPACRFAAQDKRAKDQLGVPWNDGLIEVEKDR